MLLWSFLLTVDGEMWGLSDSGPSNFRGTSMSHTSNGSPFGLDDRLGPQ